VHTPNTFFSRFCCTRRCGGLTASRAADRLFLAWQTVGSPLKPLLTAGADSRYSKEGNGDPSWVRLPWKKVLTHSVHAHVRPATPVAGLPGKARGCQAHYRSPPRRGRSRSRSMSRRSSRSRSPREDRRRNRSRTPLNGAARYDESAPQQSHGGKENQDKRVYVGNLSYEIKWPQLKDFMRTGNFSFQFSNAGF
jgi:hypothetical protein